MAAGGKGPGKGKAPKRNDADEGEADKVAPPEGDTKGDTVAESAGAETAERRSAWPAGAEVPEAERASDSLTPSDTEPAGPPQLVKDAGTPADPDPAPVADDTAATAERTADATAAPAGEAPADSATPATEPVTTPPSDTEPAQPEQAASAAVPPAAAKPEPARRGGMLGVLLGGAVAAGAGFLAAQYADPQGWPFVQPGQTAIDRALGTQADQLRALETAVTDLRTEVSALALEQADATGLADDVAAMDARVATLSDALAALGERAAAAETAGAETAGRLADIDARLTAVERAPIEGSDTAAAALESYRRELAELREQIDAALAATAAIAPLDSRVEALAAALAEFPAVDDLRNEVAGIAARLDEVIATNEALRAEAAAQVAAAAAAERAARARSALIRIEAALDSGSAYADAVADLEAAGIAVPAGLAAAAASGVPTRAQLAAGFGPAARAALAVAHRDVEGLGMADRVAAFFKAQLGIRSLAPREGDDPDAILSRAEAALGANDLAAALAELAALPPGPAAEMAAWAAAAETRKAALAAVAAVAAELDTL